MKRSPLKRRTPLRRASWFDEVRALPESVKREPLLRRTRLKPKRSKPRRVSVARDPEHRRAVRELGYCSVARTLVNAGRCWGPIQCMHVGPRNGMGSKGSDLVCAPGCAGHHQDQENYTGPFKGMSLEDKLAWGESVADTARMDILGGHGRRRAS